MHAPRTHTETGNFRQLLIITPYGARDLTALRTWLRARYKDLQEAFLRLMMKRALISRAAPSPSVPRFPVRRQPSVTVSVCHDAQHSCDWVELPVVGGVRLCLAGLFGWNQSCVCGGACSLSFSMYMTQCLRNSSETLTESRRVSCSRSEEKGACAPSEEARGKSVTSVFFQSAVKPSVRS